MSAAPAANDVLVTLNGRRFGGGAGHRRLNCPSFGSRCRGCGAVMNIIIVGLAAREQSECSQRG